MKHYPMAQRNSSVELYRIVATFAVLVVHFNGWFVDGPRPFTEIQISDKTIGQMIIQAFTCICVNMFIIISGYFGIKLRVRSILKLCFKLLFIFVPIYLAYAFYSSDFKISTFCYQALVISRAGWFIQCYIMLMFLSPALNSFTDAYGKKVLLWSLAFLLVEFWFDCICSKTLGIANSFGINGGYSFIHFVLIYMLGRCIYLYKEKLLSINRNCYLWGYLCCTMIICVLYIFSAHFTWSYSNPIVVISTICTFVPFLYKDFYNPIINWIADSTLAVYIIHSDTPIVKYLMKIDNALYGGGNYLSYLLMIMGIIIVVFAGCVIYDKICSYVINPLMDRLFPRINISF